MIGRGSSDWIFCCKKSKQKHSLEPGDTTAIRPYCKNGGGANLKKVQLVEELARKTSQGRQTDLILLDFSKAFDRVNHMKLLHKLHQHGVRAILYP